MALGHGQDVSSRKEWPLPIAGEGSLIPQGVWNTITLNWDRMTQPGGVGGGGGGPATIADGADVTQGAIADAAVVTDVNGTLSAKLRGLVKILASVWDSVNGRLKVDGSAVTQPVSGPLTDTQLRASAVPVSGGADHVLTFAGDKADVSGSSVSVSNFPATQAVSGPLTDTQLRATAVPVSGPLTDAQLRATAVPVSGGADHTLTFAGDKADVSGSSVSVSNFPASTEISNDVGNPIPVSAASLPLPSGAATDANLSALLGALSGTPGAYTIMERLNQLGLKIDRQAQAAATEATLKKLLATSTRVLFAPAGGTLLHGR